MLGYQVNISSGPNNYHIVKFMVSKWVRPKKRRPCHSKAQQKNQF